MEQADVGANGRYRDNRIVLFIGVLDHGPVGPRAQNVAADKSAHRNEGDAFCAAIRPVSMAGQVASMIRIDRVLMARVNDGAPPASPRLTALVSMVETRPAPISM